MNTTIKEIEQLYKMLDAKFRPPEQFWNPFYAERERPIPFFHHKPDEHLVTYLDSNWLNRGRALELGCGPGRNAIYLYQRGFEVDAIDISQVAIDWAIERAREASADVQFICGSVFDLHPCEEYDLMYDSGCMHTLLPHRRIQYLDMIYKGLKPGGYFGLTCFAPGYGDIGGPVKEMSDWEVYEEKSMKGGLAFSEEKLHYLLSDRFDCIELRKMRTCNSQDDRFGVPFLWASLWRKKA